MDCYLLLVYLFDYYVDVGLISFDGVLLMIV